MASEQESSAASGKPVLMTVLFFVVLLLLFYAVFGNRGILRIVQAERQSQQLQEQLTEMQAQQQQLRQEIDRLNNDRDYWEQLARTRFGMVREGELIYYLPEKKTKERE